MRVTKVKICGLTENEHIIAAAEAGADFVGVVFAQSRRRVTPEKAREMVSTVRQCVKSQAVVGVFANAPAEEINRIARECDLDLVQLSGDEDFEYCRMIDKPVIKVVHITEGHSAESVIGEIEKGFQLLQGRDVMYLMDTKIGDSCGGTGQPFSRRIAAAVAGKLPVIIAGGLDPENVGEMIDAVHPWGVDVSSGVETDGVKDIEKIKDFINEVKSAAGG